MAIYLRSGTIILQSLTVQYTAAVALESQHDA